MYFIRVSKEAEKNLEKISDYIAKDSIKRAISFTKEMMKNFNKVVSVFPYANKSENGYHKHIYKKYLIFYRIIEEKKEISVEVAINSAKYLAYKKFTETSKNKFQTKSINLKEIISVLESENKVIKGFSKRILTTTDKSQKREQQKELKQALKTHNKNLKEARTLITENFKTSNDKERSNISNSLDIIARMIKGSKDKELTG